jgi:EAL domain-containing protein (putative c-di-GMP-specific phosphodiesterase class I)
VRIVIDDFGTGYFSLSHLRQFPVDVLKIAREFVQAETDDAKSIAVTNAIVALSESLQIVTVAEGIETAEQAERMRRLGCTYGQGYFFAKPLPSTDVERATARPQTTVVALRGRKARGVRAKRVAPGLAGNALESQSA